jgi:bacillopeptidase F
VTATPTPSPVPDAADSPTIDALDNPYTNDETVDVTVNIPSAVTGLAGYTVRLYDTVPDQEAKLLREEPVGKTAVHIMVGVTLQPGRNDMQAAIFGPGGESDRSDVATWILDQSKPRISVISPKDNAQVNRTNVTIKGKSQAGAEIRLENGANGAIATAVAGSDGLWETQLQVANGVNSVTVTATDPAGNSNTMQLKLRRGSGKLNAVLSASSYRFKASRLPKTITLTVTVTDPDGQRLQGATALFTVSVPGLEAIVSAEITTNRDGVATFQTTIPAGAMAGSGLATVLITTDRDGQTTDRQVLTVVE